MEDPSLLKVKIIDFGLSCKDKNIAKKKKRCGTPGYVAPEILNSSSASFKSDIFSLGCMFYNLITRK